MITEAQRPAHAGDTIVPKKSTARRRPEQRRRAVRMCPLRSDRSCRGGRGRARRHRNDPPGSTTPGWPGRNWLRPLSSATLIPTTHRTLRVSRAGGVVVHSYNRENTLFRAVMFVVGRGGHRDSRQPASAHKTLGTNQKSFSSLSSIDMKSSDGLPAVFGAVSPWPPAGAPTGAAYACFLG